MLLTKTQIIVKRFKAWSNELQLDYFWILEMTNKILIIRFSSIGDIVLTTPVIRMAKEQIENAEIHFLTKSSFRPILEKNPNIDKLHYVDKNLIEVVRELKKENFSFIIDLHNNLRTARIKPVSYTHLTLPTNREV